MGERDGAVIVLFVVGGTLGYVFVCFKTACDIGPCAVDVSGRAPGQHLGVVFRLALVNAEKEQGVTVELVVQGVGFHVNVHGFPCKVVAFDNAHIFGQLVESHHQELLRFVDIERSLSRNSAAGIGR